MAGTGAARPVIGFIGTGHLADYTVRGLRHGAWDGRIVLSPRGAATAAKLAAECGCEIATDNQAVADAADIVVLATRPADALAALAALQLEARHTLLSVVAGVPVAELTPHAGAAGAIVRALPVTSAEFAASPTLVWPPNALVEDLFNHCGAAVPVTSEADYDSAAVLTCIYGSFFLLMDRIQCDTEAAGIPAASARALVTGMMEGAARTAAAQPRTPLADLAAAITTEGSYSRIVRDTLENAGALTPWSHAFTKVLAKFRRDAD